MADEQITRLIESVHDWARRTFPDSPDGHVAAECQWCPLCQFARVLRGERPDVSAKVAEAGTALAAAFRSFVDAASAGDDSEGTGDSGDAGGSSQHPRVERIDLAGDENRPADDEPAAESTDESTDEPGDGNGGSAR